MTVRDLLLTLRTRWRIIVATLLVVLGVTAYLTLQVTPVYQASTRVYLLANNQEEYGYLGAKWLFEHLNGEGKVWYTRGIAGHPADTDRHTAWSR